MAHPAAFLFMKHFAQAAVSEKGVWDSRPIWCRCDAILNHFSPSGSSWGGESVLVCVVS